VSRPRDIHLLCAEDDAGLARLLQRKLELEGYIVDVAPDGGAGLAMAEEGSYDVLLLDHKMPVRSGLDVIRTLAARNHLPPTIVVTGGGNEKVAVKAMKLGAADYVVKDTGAGYLELLPTVIEQVLSRARLAEEKRRAEEELRASEEKYRTLTENIPVGLYRTTAGAGGRVVSSNRAFAAMFGFDDVGDLVTRRVVDYYARPEDRGAFIEKVRTDGAVESYEVLLKRRDGSEFWGSISARAIYGEDGALAFLDGAVRDITKRKRAEEAVRRARDELEERVEERTAELTRALEKLGESEVKYRGVVEQVQDGLVIVQDGVLKFANQAVADKLGCAVDELIGKDYVSLIAPEARAQVAEHYRERLAGEDPRSVYEAAVIGRDGGAFPVEVSAGLVQYEGRGATLAIVRDLSQRREQEKVVREQRWILENVLNNMSELVYVFDPDTYEILFTNGTAEAALAEELVGKPCFRAIWGLEAPCHGCRVESVYTDEGGTYTREAFNERLGRWLRVAVRAVPWLDGGQVCCAVAADISESKALEEEIVAHNRALNRMVKERTAALEAKNRELESFAYSVSHDLRAPLRSIEGFSRALLEDYGPRLDGEGRDFLTRVVNGAVRMDRLINDLLSYSRLGRRGVEYEVVDTTELVAAAVQDMDEDIKAAGARVEVAEPLPEVEGDRAMMLVLLHNLIGNAIKYRRPDAAPEVKVACRTEGNKAVFSVTDNGIGLETKFQNKVFDIFKRLHTDDRYPGTGIGLASAKKVVEAHGGRIWYESEIGKGATFYFELPRRRHEEGAGGGL
jgi:PAS domain S-box-containing protein